MCDLTVGDIIKVEQGTTIPADGVILQGETSVDESLLNGEFLPKVKAVDTNGAGDLFAGAFLYGITNGHSYADSGKLASLASSKLVTQFGPRLEWHQSKDLLNKLINNQCIIK